VDEGGPESIQKKQERLTENQENVQEFYWASTTGMYDTHYILVLYTRDVAAVNDFNPIRGDRSLQLAHTILPFRIRGRYKSPW
jgi:hypothetical protein